MPHTRGSDAGTSEDLPPRVPLSRRAAGTACAAALLAAAGAAPAAADVPSSRGVNARGPGADTRSRTTAHAVVSGGLGGTYIRVAADISSVLDGTGIRVLPAVSKGSGENLDHLLHTRGIDVALVQADALADLRRRATPDAVRTIEYAAKLYDEEIHLLARREIADIAGLAGKRVNVDRRGSGTALTASVLFGALGLTVEAVHDDQETALGRLLRGEIAALAYVAGKPVHLLSRLGGQEAGALHLLPVPLDAALLDTYVPARIERADYPALVGGEGGVETFGVGTVLAMYVWPPGTERHDNLSRFVAATFDRMAALKRPPHHPKWRDVDLRSQVPGWTRFAPARAWMRRQGGTPSDT